MSREFLVALQSAGLLRADADLDLVYRTQTAVISGVITQQLANAPGEPFETGTFTSTLPGRGGHVAGPPRRRPGPHVRLNPQKGTSMTASTTTRPAPRAAVLDREPALRLAATEYGRFGSLLGTLAPRDWSRPTDCPAWDVRAMAGHVLGMAQMVASARSFVAQNVGSARAGGGIDALTALQVRSTARLSPDELVDRFAVVSSPRGSRPAPAAPASSGGSRCPRTR